MIKYQLRVVALVTLINDIIKGRLIPNAYFQRNLVWRDVHKREFIDTILMGYPFPQIFVSRGKIDVIEMKSTSCIVDGQQRTNAIREYIEDKFAVNGKKYSDLTNDQKESFLKYEIGVVELDLDNDDPRVREMFKRVNRTSNSLTAIEKLASEYGATAFMMTAKVLSDDVRLGEVDDDSDNVEDGLYIDPAIDDDLENWARSVKPKNFQKLISEGGIFSAHEVKRKIPLMYTLNILSTLESGFFRRNEATLSLLEDYREDYPSKDAKVKLLDQSASTFTKLKLPKTSMWRNKASFFSLIVYIAAAGGDLADHADAREKLLAFEANVPADYAQAAKEAVNNKAERELRQQYLAGILG